MSLLTRDGWVDAHAYLRPVGELCARIERAAAGLDAEDPVLPDWNDYDSDFRAGVPLLRSPAAAIDLEPAGRMVGSLVERVASDSDNGKVAAKASALAAELRARPDAPRLVAAWLLGDETFDPSSPGLLRYLGWTATSRYLSPLVDAFGRWRDEERWHRKYCPTCGSAPAMGQLVGVDPGRMRLLSCGCCGTRWQFKRTGCPFCEADSQRLASVSIEEEPVLRIDYCESCKGYLKTYDGQGHERVLLSDWTTLHLDVLAHDRGLKRLAASLYEIENTI